MHRIVNHSEVFTVKQGLDGTEVKDALQKRNVRLSGRNNLNNNRTASVISGDAGAARSSDINLGEVRADFVVLNGSGVGVGGLHKVFGSRSSILSVVLDSKIFLWSTGVVTSSEDESSESFLPNGAAFANHSRNSRGREQSVLSNPETLHSVSNTHFDDSLDSFIVEITTVTTNQKSSLRQTRSSGYNSVKHRLHKVVQVVLRHEFLSLPTKSGSSWLLTSNGSSGNDCWLQSTKSNFLTDVKSGVFNLSRNILGFIRFVGDRYVTNEAS
mmetsp:Transcript_11337/g.16257  ORF Transcript_11337/g.16257 Transcript_11337/m.16257 type:complete len:270 (-) Transcript_11337:1366-2175(-)